MSYYEPIFAEKSSLFRGLCDAMRSSEKCRNQPSKLWVGGSSPPGRAIPEWTCERRRFRANDADLVPADPDPLGAGLVADGRHPGDAILSDASHTCTCGGDLRVADERAQSTSLARRDHSMRQPCARTWRHRASRYARIVCVGPNCDAVGRPVAQAKHPRLTPLLRTCGRSDAGLLVSESPDAIKPPARL